MTTTRTRLATLAVAGACTFLGACGGDDKPAYCSDVTDFKDAVSGLSEVQVTDVNALTTAIEKVKTSGQTLVASAKSEYGAQASALQSSITALTSTANQLADPTSRRVALQAIPAEVTAVKGAFQSLSDSVKTKCD